MSSPKWSGKSKKFNPSRTFVMSDSTPTRKYNLKSTFQPGSFPSPTFTSSNVIPSPVVDKTPVTNSPEPLGGLYVPPIPPQVPPEPASVLDDPNTDALAFSSLYHPPLRPLQYHTYAPQPFRKHMVPLQPHEKRPSDLFVPADIHRELADRNAATLQVLSASNLPEFVHVYHSLVPLDMGPGKKDEQVFGSPVQHYKAVSHTNGRTYMLLRVNNYDSTEQENALQVINKWKRVNNGSVIGVVEAFTTFAFGGPPQKQCLVVVYEWWPLARPLCDLPSRELDVLWNIAVQLFGAILSVHRRGLALRGLLTDRFVLFTGTDRVRISSLGLLDILQPYSSDLQPQDFRDLGALLCSLQPQSPSQEFSEFLNALKDAHVERAHQLLSPHVFRVQDLANQKIDSLEANLSRELENGRVFRLLSKLEYALQLPEDYSPLSPKYPLVLFKEYAFHQTSAQGTPTLNLAHALAVLNKLDAGIDEKILLCSRDGKTRIVVSYMELKQIFTAAFEGLKK